MGSQAPSTRFSQHRKQPAHPGRQGKALRQQGRQGRKAVSFAALPVSADPAARQQQPEPQPHTVPRVQCFICLCVLLCAGVRAWTAPSATLRTSNSSNSSSDRQDVACSALGAASRASPSPLSRHVACRVQASEASDAAGPAAGGSGPTAQGHQPDSSSSWQRWTSVHDRDILALALPAALALAADPLLGMVDTALIGRLGADELVSAQSPPWCADERQQGSCWWGWRRGRLT